jgi:S-adenosylmethionine uptake transporter
MNNAVFRGICWFIFSLVISCLNDAISKYLGSDLHPIQITFLRFFFGTLVLLPFMAFNGRKAFATSRPAVHFLRGLCLFGGIALWNYGLNVAPITVVTLISFTIPLFTIIMAMIFLKEKVGMPRWIASLMGFVGIAVVIFMQPSDEASLFSGTHTQAIVLIISAVLFAMLDVINKKYVVKESMLSMLFYSALITCALGLIPSYNVWVEPTMSQYALLLCLGAGANLILYCLLKAFSQVDASGVAPFRYFELVVSAALGFIIFQEIPTHATIIGSAIIIPSTLYIALYETRKKRKQQKLEEEKLNASAA